MQNKILEIKIEVNVVGEFHIQYEGLVTKELKNEIHNAICKFTKPVPNVNSKPKENSNP